MKRIIDILLVGGLLCLGSCNNKQVSQKKDAQELAEKSHNKELNEMLKQFESYVKNKDKEKAASYYEKVVGKKNIDIRELEEGIVIAIDKEA